MTTYVALLRGIMPMNPNMRGEKLRGVFESLGFRNVKTVIASGNVVFQSSYKNMLAIEEKIEEVLPEKLGFKSTTIVRSHQELLKLFKKAPFKGVEDKQPNYLIVTFFKNRKKELCRVVKLGEGSTPDFMRKVEKKHGKEITTRTWKTTGRLLKAMNVMDDN